MNTYEFIETFDNKSAFTYVVILIISLFIFSKYTIELNIMLALIISTIVIIYLNQKNIAAAVSAKEKDDLKYDTITPNPKNISKGSDVIDFLFSVQDFYVYNPQAYEEMVDNLDAFFLLNENIFLENQFSNYYYQIAESKKNNALNSFQSLIFKLPAAKLVTDKFDRAHRRLETILNKYMNNIYDQCQYNLKKNGYNILKTPLETGPVGHNTYDDEDFSYEFY